MQSGDIKTLEDLREELRQPNKDYQYLSRENQKQYQEIIRLDNENKDLKDALDVYSHQQPSYDEPDYRGYGDRRRGKGLLFWILVPVITVLLMAAAASATSYFTTGSFIPKKPSQAAQKLDQDREPSGDNAPGAGETPAVTDTPEPVNGDQEASEEQLSGTNTPSAPELTPTPTHGSLMGINNRYAILNGNDVNLRAGKGTDKKSTDKLKKGTYVWILWTEETAENNEEWSYVIVNGMKGYIRSTYLSVLSVEESTNYDSAQPSTVPKET